MFNVHFPKRNNMRRFLSLLVMFLAVLPITAQNTLNVHQKDGQVFSFGFEEKPVVTFTDNELVVTSPRAEARYQLASVAKFTFDDSGTAVEGIKDDSGKAVISLDEYTVSLTGAKSGIGVQLIGSDGKVIQSLKTDKNGSLTFSIAELPEGTFIISSDNLSVKILKK